MEKVESMESARAIGKITSKMKKKVEKSRGKSADGTPKCPCCEQSMDATAEAVFFRTFGATDRHTKIITECEAQQNTLATLGKSLSALAKPVDEHGRRKPERERLEHELRELEARCVCSCRSCSSCYSSCCCCFRARPRRGGR
jgi:hypothetical protein